MHAKNEKGRQEQKPLATKTFLVKWIVMNTKYTVETFLYDDAGDSTYGVTLSQGTDKKNNCILF